MSEGHGGCSATSRRASERRGPGATLAVNRELPLYRQIGRSIRERQETHGWGTAGIDRLSADLRRAFPDMKGFSPRTLRSMRAVAAGHPDPDFLQQVAALRLLDAVPETAEREWYARQAIAHGRSRAVLTHQIETKLHARQGQADSNFSRTLPAQQSDLARQVLKDPYHFDFLSLGEEAHERNLERGLLDHIRAFLLELGVGFAFLGSQYRLDVAGREYYIDLLFYHARLHCYVVIDLKTVEFEPAFAGTMNFYFSAVNDLLRTPGDQPSIGMILCKGKDTAVAEYALRDLSKPIGVSQFDMAGALPSNLRGSLPTIEELEASLSTAADDDPATDET